MTRKVLGRIACPAKQGLGCVSGLGVGQVDLVPGIETDASLSSLARGW